MSTKLRLIGGDRVARTGKGGITRSTPCSDPPPIPPTCCSISPQSNLYADITGGMWDGERVELSGTIDPHLGGWIGQTTDRNCGADPTNDQLMVIHVVCDVASSEWIVTVTVAADCQATESPLTIPWESGQCACDPDDINCTPGTRDCPAILTGLVFTLTGSECGTCDGPFTLDIHCNAGVCYFCQDAINLPQVIPNIEVDLGEATYDPIEGCKDPERELGLEDINCCDQIKGLYTLSAHSSAPCCWEFLEWKSCPRPMHDQGLYISVCGPIQIDSGTWRVTARVSLGAFSIEGCWTDGIYEIDLPGSTLPDCTEIFKDLVLELSTSDIPTTGQECTLPPTLTINLLGARQVWGAGLNASGTAGSFENSLLAIIDTSSDVIQEHEIFSQDLVADLTLQSGIEQSHSTLDQTVFAGSEAIDATGLAMQTHSTFDQDLVVDVSKQYTGAQNHTTFDQEGVAIIAPLASSDAAQDHAIFDQDISSTTALGLLSDVAQEYSSFDQTGNIVNQSIITGDSAFSIFEQAASSINDRIADINSHQRTRSQDIVADLIDIQGSVAQSQTTFDQDLVAQGLVIILDGLPIHSSFSQDAVAEGEILNLEGAQTYSSFDQSVISATERAGDTAQTHSTFSQDSTSDVASDADIIQDHAVFDQDLAADLIASTDAAQTHSTFSQEGDASRIQVTLNADSAQNFSIFEQSSTVELELRVNVDSLYANHLQGLTAERHAQGTIAQEHSTFDQVGGATILPLSIANSDVAQTHSTFDQAVDTLIEVSGDIAQAFTTYNQDLTGLLFIQGDIAQLHSTYDQDLTAEAGCSVSSCTFECNELEEGWFQIADNCFSAECECGPVPIEEVCTSERYGQTIEVDCVAF